MKKSVLSFTLGALINFAAFAGEGEVSQIEQAVATLDTQALSQYSESMQGYDKGLALYRLAMSQYLTAQPELAKTHLNQATEHLEAMLESQSLNEQGMGETSALLSQVYGLQIALDPMQGARLGAKADAMLKQAEKYIPNSPRVHLIKGISAYNTPAAYGGSKAKALEHFDAAIALYAQEQTSAYSWGEAETYTWRGITQLELGENNQAKQDWQQALDINPNYGWAKMLIAKNQ